MILEWITRIFIMSQTYQLLKHTHIKHAGQRVQDNGSSFIHFTNPKVPCVVHEVVRYERWILDWLVDVKNTEMHYAMQLNKLIG